MYPSQGLSLGESVRQRSQQDTFTILFADLRDSTGLSEQLSAEEMVQLLNTFLGALARPIIAHGGIVDKFLGDGVMAVFGMDGDPSRGAIPAARAALDMHQAVEKLNKERVARGEKKLGCGVGICTGNVIIDRIGLPEIPEISHFTAIGMTVNTAARLSGLRKKSPEGSEAPDKSDESDESGTVEITLSEETTKKLEEASEFETTPLEPVPIRGLKGEIPVWALVSPSSHPPRGEKSARHPRPAQGEITSSP